MSKITEIYTDGGCRQLGDETHAGWGTHIKLSSGAVIDGAGKTETPTNNAAELSAAIKGFDMINQIVENGAPVDPKLDVEIKESDKNNFLFKSDSMYVIKGLTKFAPKWAENGWVTSTGTQVQNKALWEDLVAKSSRLTDNGVAWKIEHVKAHVGIEGNERADKLATRGITHSHKGLADDWIAIPATPSGKPKKFKKQDISALLSGNRWMFYSESRNNRTYQEPSTEMRQTMMCQFEDDSDLQGAYLGKPSSGAMYGIVRQREEKLISKAMVSVEKAQTDYVGEGYIYPVIGLMDKVTTAGTEEQLDLHGEKCLGNNNGSVALWNDKDEQLTILRSPALLASYAAREFDKLSSLLDDFCIYLDTEAKKGLMKDAVVTDITDKFFSRSEKGKLEFHKEHRVGTNAFPHEFVHQGIKATFPLTATIDLPPRNNLAKLAKQYKEVQVFVIQYASNPANFKHAQVFVCDNDIAIYEAAQSSLKVVPRKKKK